MCRRGESIGINKKRRSRAYARSEVEVRYFLDYCGITALPFLQVPSPKCEIMAADEWWRMNGGAGKVNVV
jgi:hypothetical protein